MSALAQVLVGRSTTHSGARANLAMIVLGSVLMAGLAQLSVRLPFTPVPVTGQTLGVLLVGASLGPWRGGAAMLLYLGEGAAGLPVFAEGASGIQWLTPAGPTGGYLWGFVAAAAAVGFLAEVGWDRSLGSAIGAMLAGEVVIFGFGVPWLANALGLPGAEAIAAGLHPFVLGEVLKVLLAATLLPAAWKLVGDRDRRIPPDA